ncbi:MAG: iron donor protein CyaY [Acidobacteriota bacterium]|nr:iron donor protein CyaY [Acidobacteriota bacterium]
MDDQEFKKRVDGALNDLYRALSDASDEYGFEADFNSGALSVEFENPPAKFVVSPNSPVRQVWVSALSKSYKLDWDIVENSFVYGESKETLKALMERVIGKQLHNDVTL